MNGLDLTHLMKGKGDFHDGGTTASLFIHGDFCDVTVRMWSNFMDTAVFQPRDNLQLATSVTQPGSKNLI